MSGPWFTPHIGTWRDLVLRLDATDTLGRWRAGEPALADVSTCEDLDRLSHEPVRSDAVLGCLLRLASVNGGADNDATLVLMHLLAPGCTALLRRFGPERSAAKDLLFGELALHIRTSTRLDARAHAANLLWRTEHGLRKQLSARRMNGAWLNDCPVAFQADEQTGLLAALDRDTRRQQADEDDLQLVDVLLWAERTGVVAAEDVSLLVELVQGDEAPGRDTARVAASRGVSVRTVERRRRAAVEALSGASAAYLAAA